MTITKAANENVLTLKVSGRLDTNTAPQLESEIQESIEGVKKLILNFEELVYVSSAGLRVILAAQKQMNRQGSMIIRNVNSTVMEVFEITGFVDILTIE
jgi:anti-sigma B factor antagonist